MNISIDVLLMLMILLVTMIIAVKAIVLVPENARLAVIRMGRLHSVSGPGLTILVPFVDLGITVSLNDHVPDWQSISEQELLAKVEKLVKANPDPKVFK